MLALAVTSASMVKPFQKYISNFAFLHFLNLNAFETNVWLYIYSYVYSSHAVINPGNRYLDAQINAKRRTSMVLKMLI